MFLEVKRLHKVDFDNANSMRLLRAVLQNLRGVSDLFDFRNASANQNLSNDDCSVARDSH